MNSLLGVYVDGETKTGKGAAGKAMVDALDAAGIKVYYDVAGDFFRRYAAAVRESLELSDTGQLPEDEKALERVVRQVHDQGPPFERSDRFGDLQKPIISASVAAVAKFEIVQEACGQWLRVAAMHAQAKGADVLVLDGRNVRSHLRKRAADLKLATAFELYLLCEPREAARRALLANGATSPSGSEIDERAAIIGETRQRDRHREVRPYVMPATCIRFDPKQSGVAQVLRRIWEAHTNEERPLPVCLDNTTISKPDMLAAVSELAVAAVRLAQATLAAG
ncbi:MAG TPA: (d)CMP kinase [Candidatus Saccharimonadales bacterium]|jgi:cytidylate kinase